MSEIVDKVRAFVQEKCNQHKANPEYGYYDYWNDHIKRVIYHAIRLANDYGVDVEIVELGALLHDISMPSEYGERSEHHFFSAEMAENLLSELSYPNEKIAIVRKCVFNHPGRNAHLRDSLEESCVSDADALAHFDRIPSLFKLAFSVLNMDLNEGRNYVKSRLQGDYDGLSEHLKPVYRAKFETIMETVFVD